MRLSVLLVVFLLIASSCSRKKSTFMTRNYRAIATEYNILYNGDLALDQGNQNLAQNYNDDFFEILHLERIQLPDETQGLTQRRNSDFERAEQKAVKAIQKHSIFINGKEHNPQIDEAYMMLGKARYYEARFIPAIEAFNFILHRYPTSNNVNAAKIWREKTNIRLKNEELAIKNLKELFETGTNILDEDFADASAMLAQAYIQLESLDSSLVHIKNAANYTKNNELKGRYLFVKGQVYNRLQFRDSAQMAFDEVIAMNRKIPREYLINAHIEKARNFDYENAQDGSEHLLCEHLLNLAEDRENRPFLDLIHHQLGMHYKDVGDIDNSFDHFNKSLRLFTQNNKLQALNYSTLGDMSFDQAKYRVAGQYYDSTLVYMPEISREYRQIKKKRDNLVDVIHYEEIAQVNDSILRLVQMSEADRLAYFTEITNALKEKAIADSIALAKKQQTADFVNNEFFGNQMQTQAGEDGVFYFYNNTAVSFGKQDFRRQWGDRKLEDNWRLSNKGVSDMEMVGTSDSQSDQGITGKKSILDDPKFDPQTYLARIPSDPAAIDSLKTDRDMAYYQLGLIYKEKFKEYQLGADRLEKLLTFQPEERLIVPAKYHLYKIYGILENGEKEQYYRNDILAHHADTRYAEIIRNPEALLSSDESSPEYKYYQLYQQFEAQQYAEVIQQSEQYIFVFTGEAIVPKLEMLKATAIGRQDGFEAYKKALNYVALNYPNTEEGKKAMEIHNTTLKQFEKFNFAENEESKRWKLVYEFDSVDKENQAKTKETIDQAIEALKYNYLSTSLDYYTADKTFLVVHGMYSREGAQGFAEMIKHHKDYKLNLPSFEISSENYSIVQIHKNIDLYNEKIK